MGHGKQEHPKRLTEKLIRIRTKLGLSQTEMARALEKQGVKAYPGYVARYETGDRVPGLLTTGAYAEIAGISADKLINDKLDLPAKYK
ncbi:MAG TPA: helix-turn-helix transcriptional regulator [Pyrinomonadaceae bacterium]|jgi:transcriptional regulator with XRE-family HTH domain|nr:helix-turn-helix transcriptional regulator [Pyrinomonadaceae bacterium]